MTVQGHTQLDAGVIASTGGDVCLDTGSFGWSDAAGCDRSRSTTIGAGGSIGRGRRRQLAAAGPAAQYGQPG